MNLRIVRLLARTAALGSISAAGAEMGMSSSLAICTASRVLSV